MKKIRFLLFSIAFLAVYLSCSKTTEEGPDLLDRAVKFDPDVQNIMFNHCTTCHGGLVPSAGVDLTTYQNVRFYTESGNLGKRMEDASNPMPPSGLLSPTQRQIIVKWVEDGYPEN